MDLHEGQTLVLDTGTTVTVTAPTHPGIWAAEGTPGNYQIPMVVKAARRTNRAEGNRIEVESRVYEYLRDSPTLQIPDIKVLTYYGKCDVGGTRAIALERAEFSLDRVVYADPELRDDLCLQLAHSLLTTLLALERARATQDRFTPTKFRAHRDIKPANSFLVKRQGRFDVVLGDFGFAYDAVSSDGSQTARGIAAPEQRGVDPRDSGLDSDLWAVGLTLWQMYHHGLTPYRNDEGTWLAWDHHDVQNNAKVLAWDLDYTPEDILDERRPAGDPPALRAARRLLIHSSGSDRIAVAREVLEEVTEPFEAMMARRMSPEGHERFVALLEGANLIDSAREAPHLAPEALATAGRNIVVLTPTHSAVRRRWQQLIRHRRERPADVVTPRPPRERKHRVRRWGSRLVRALLLVLRVVGTASAVAVAATVAGWWQVMALPDQRIDDLVRTVVGAALLAAAAISFALAVTWRWATPENRRRRIVPWAALVSGALAGGLVAFLVVGLLDEPLNGSGVLVACACGVFAAVVYGRNPIRPGRPLTEREVDALPARVPPPRRVAFSIAAGLLGVGALVVTLVVPLPVALKTHEVSGELVGLVPGMPDNAPVFIDPHAIAVNDRGDVAVVDRVGVGRDVVWIVPESRDSAPYSVLSTLSWRAPEGVTASIPEGDERDPVQSLASDWTSTALAAPVRSVAALDFWDDDTLILLGEDGVTRLDFSRDDRGATVSTELITDRVTDHGYRIGRRSQLLVEDGRIYMLRVTGPEDTPDYEYCEFTNAGLPVLWFIDQGETEPKPVVRSTYKEDTCIDVPRALFGKDGSPRIVAPHWNDTDKAYELVTSQLDGRGSKAIEGLTVDDSVREFVSSGGRTLINTAYCLAGTSTDVALPTITAQSVSFYEPTDNCDDVPASWKNAIDVEPKTFDERPPCSTANTVSNLWMSGYHWTPMTVGGPDNSIYVLSPPGMGCSPLILRISNTDATATSVGNVKTQSVFVSDYELGTTAIMSASKPLASADDIRWYAPALGRIQTSYTGVNTTGFSVFNSNDDRPITIIKLENWVTAELGSVDVDTDKETTQLSIHFEGPTTAQSDDYRVSVNVKGLTDMVLDSDRNLVVSRCGKILRIPQAALRDLADPAVPEVMVDDPAVLSEEVSVLVGSGDWFAPCEPITSAAWASVQGLESSIAPAAIFYRDEGDDGEHIYVAEAALFGTQVVSRLRDVDLAARTIRTVGFDPDNPKHVDENVKPRGDVLAGDLARYGLVPTDLAVGSDGRIAVSTASATGTGPLLLIEGNETRVIDPGNDREVTGVAWRGTQLVITDGSRGDLAVYDLPKTAESPESPWRRWIAAIVAPAPPQGVG